MWRTPAVLAGLACFALAMGVLVYVADRAGAPPALLAPFALKGTGPLFAGTGSWLPSFVHPFAFALLTAAARPLDAGPAYGSCAAWWAVNVAFEAAQHPRIRLFAGTFDVGDIVAATLGAFAAAALIWLAHHSREVP